MPEGTRTKRTSRVRIELTPRLCKACGICIEMCPRDVFTAEEGTGKAVVSYPELCSDCGMCELYCPDYAISLEREAAE